ncbi:uncharacterized protein PITG_18793 [Phytophthora infestans T30-4]|uniref:Uncharacterized protein n=1 Tax=Phytophthora infestans (strain T30-4) TaxID=403677 RepID=D0NZE8_PHYIT|nr:uncharacterized protein PITG_18793 [Phytophthora infestans T30-4]EEY69502.1 hypothetical protein PITG_18793 [Phytophthora infestans T30-4]|eukprot:XP_002997269.1 hypothetical protein PITG_18793 [Phytophthora infestans T30-4]
MRSHVAYTNTAKEDEMDIFVSFPSWRKTSASILVRLGVTSEDELSKLLHRKLIEIGFVQAKLICVYTLDDGKAF